MGFFFWWFLVFGLLVCVGPKTTTNIYLLGSSFPATPPGSIIGSSTLAARVESSWNWSFDFFWHTRRVQCQVPSIVVVVVVAVVFVVKKKKKKKEKKKGP